MDSAESNGPTKERTHTKRTVVDSHTATTTNVVGKPTGLRRLQGDMGNLLINLPSLGHSSPLQKINHMDKCSCYFYPSFGSDSIIIYRFSQA